jgi:hypothetical protein
MIRPLWGSGLEAGGRSGGQRLAFLGLERKRVADFLTGLLR